MKKGFTLIELLLVIAILGIFAVVAIPRYIDANNKKKAINNCFVIQVGEIAYYKTHGEFIRCARTQYPENDPGFKAIGFTTTHTSNLYEYSAEVWPDKSCVIVAYQGEMELCRVRITSTDVK